MYAKCETPSKFGGDRVVTTLRGEDADGSEAFAASRGDHCNEDVEIAMLWIVPEFNQSVMCTYFKPP